MRHAYRAITMLLGGVAMALPAAAEVPAITAAALPGERVAFSVVFPPRDGAALASLIAAQNRKGDPQFHQWLTPASFADRFGPTAETLAGVAAELAARGLTVGARQGQMLHVAGTAEAVQSAFGVRLAHARFSDGSAALVADHQPVMPPRLAAAGALTPDFSTVPPMRTHSRITGPIPFNFISATGPYLAADLRQAYDYPSATALTAKGVHIGILMSAGFNPADMAAYFKDDGLPTSLQPSITTVNINGGAPYSAAKSGETHLDLQQSGAISLSATITLYNLSDLGSDTIIYGLNQIVSDNVADVVSMSFGIPEYDLLPAANGGKSQVYMAELEDILFQQGTSQGITFVASSGDHGAIPPAGAAGKPTLSVEEPSSDPYVVAVGGTNLVTKYTSGSDNSAYVSENELYDTEANGEVWASGGGISQIWAKPSYQSSVPTQSTKARTVPDLSQHMGGCPGDATKCHTPHSADYEVLGGQAVGVIGTSASAPDIAGLFALKVAMTGGRLGWENVDIYTRAKAQIAGTGKPFHQAITGNNGHYATTKPYNLVIGNGSVDARQLIGATKLPAAGVPGTATNP